MIETDEGAARPQRSREAFFGRHKGKTLSPLQARLFDDLLPRLRLDPAASAPADLASLFPVAVSAVRLEIGFGGGEHLRHESARHPGTGFIGIEPFVNGMAKMLVALSGEPRPNLRLYDDDAVRILDWLPEASLDGIDLFYPDPWPKKKHWKRRFVSQRNLDRFARVLRSGAPFRFASDIDTYVEWTVHHCARHPSFAIARPEGEWATPYEGWPGTRYEAKAHREGRSGRYLIFRRA